VKVLPCNTASRVGTLLRKAARPPETPSCHQTSTTERREGEEKERREGEKGRREGKEKRNARPDLDAT